MQPSPIARKITNDLSKQHFLSACKIAQCFLDTNVGKLNAITGISFRVHSKLEYVHGDCLHQYLPSHDL